MRFEILKKPDWDKIGKNLRFGLASGLMKTAKEGQAEVIKTIKSEFTTRGRWMEPSTPFGIRITPAKRDAKEIEATVQTAADWLLLHETGGTKKPQNGNLAVPTENVRRNKRDIIQKAQRPRNLKNAFVLQTKKGPVLFQKLFGNASGKFTTRKLKTNRGTRLVAVYGLEKSAKIKKRSTFYEPLEALVEKHGDRNVLAAIDAAFATMK